MPIKASKLIEMLQEHVSKYGDDHVMIFDDYEVVYKTFDKSCISRNENRFIIECRNDEI